MDGAIRWEVSASVPALGGDEVHVWAADLDVSDGRDRGVVAEDEQARADRFLDRRIGDRFTAARSILRRLLGAYVGNEPKDLRFQYGPHGKPALKGEAELRFNLSHSHGLGLFAFARGRDVGIDVEHVDPKRAGGGVADRFFAPGEADGLRALPEELRPEAFFACWTRKEAWLKAMGKGISFGLDRVEVSLAPGEPAALIKVGDDPSEAARWFITSLDPAPGYAAALVVPSPHPALRCWRRSAP